MNNKINILISKLKNELDSLNKATIFEIVDKNNLGISIRVDRDYAYFDTYIKKHIERIEEEIDYWENKIKDNEK